MSDELKAASSHSSFIIPLSSLPESGYFVEDSVCGFELRHERERGGLFAVAGDERDEVRLGVEARAVLRDVVGDDGVEVLAVEFAAGVLDDVVGLGGEADDEEAVAARARDFGE